MKEQISIVKALYTLARSKQSFTAECTDREALDKLYEDALVQQAVDVPVRDALSSWREIKDGSFNAADSDLGIKDVLIEAGVNSRKYGKALILPVITDLQDNRISLSKTMESILEEPTQYKLARLIVVTDFESSSEKESNILSDNYGKPKSYKVNGGMVTASRAIIVSANSIGTSFITSINDYLCDFKSRNAETTTAVEESNWLAFGTDLNMLIESAQAMSEAKGGDPEAIVSDLLKNRTRELRQNAKNTNAWAYDKNSEKVDQVSKTNIDAMVNATEQSAKFLAAAADIPMSRFLGYRAGGLGADSDGNYSQTLSGLRASMFEHPLKSIDKIVLALNTDIKSGEFEWGEIVI